MQNVQDLEKFNVYQTQRGKDLILDENHKHGNTGD